MGSMTSRGMPWRPPFVRAHWFHDKGYALGPSIVEKKRAETQA